LGEVARTNAEGQFSYDSPNGDGAENVTHLIFQEVNHETQSTQENHFLVAIVLAVIGVVLNFVSSLSGFAIWLVLVAFILLAWANLIEGL